MPETVVGTGESSALSIGRRIGGRYRIESEVGEGGVAQVVCAYDEHEDRRVALKGLLLQECARSQERLLAMFRHEFSVLTQVAHPNVVRVYDFGFADGMPYYTMELLEGQPLSEIAPLPPGEVVELMRSLCEPLSILHARGWVHRDLSARNVIRTKDGAIKLIDFGATVSMNDRHAPMGTPPFMAPEALAQEPLDARADIFGLGALAYFALTGKHAYPARSLARLPVVWADLPRRPSELNPEVPESLDELVMEMLSLQPSGRPYGGAEVLQRLRGGKPNSLPPGSEVARGHLVAPTLIGRDVQMRQIHGLLQSTAQGRGGVCVIRGERGVGRSRLLDALGLQTRLAGHPLLRASGKLTGSEPLALARSLGETALRVLLEEDEPVPPGLEWLVEKLDLGKNATAEAQRALVDWLSARCDRTPLVILIDDVELADPASQKLLAQLALTARKRRLLIAVAVTDSAPAPGSPLRLLHDQGVLLQLPPLTEAQVEDWARSVFGDVPNLARLSRWLHPVSGGMPAACTAFAEYLVEQRVAVLSGGTFSLPDSFEGLSLPSSVRDALGQRLAALSEHARGFLELLAVELQPLPCTIDEYLQWFAANGGDDIAALSELTAAQVLAVTENGYVLRSASAIDWAQTQLTVERKNELHRQLAAQHEAAAQSDVSVVYFASYHLWKVDDLAAADRVMGDFNVLRSSATKGGGGAAFSRSDAAIAMLEALLGYRKQVGAAPSRVTPVLVALLSRASLTRADLVSYTDETMMALRYDLGLDLWDEQPAELSPAERMGRCVNAAIARHAATPEDRRGIEPLQALRYLAAACASASGAYSIRYEPEHLWPLQRTIALFRDVSPALGLIADVLHTPAITQGWGTDATEHQRRIVETTREPIPDFDEELRKPIHALNAYYLAQQLSAEGNEESLQYAPALEAQPLYAALGLQVRRTQALMTGRYRDAQRYRRERELLVLQSESSDQHLHMSVLREHQTAYICGDLLELTRCGAALRERAKRFPGWKPWLALNDARVCVLSEDFEQAHAVLDAAFTEVEPFKHGAWLLLATTRAEICFETADYVRCREVARDVLDRAVALGAVLDNAAVRLRSLAAAAEIGLGNAEEGCAQLRALLEETAIAPGKQSLIHARVGEIFCRVALTMGDEPTFAEHHGQLKALYAEHPGLRARYTRLQRHARERFEQRSELVDHNADAPAWAERLKTALATQSSEDHADYLLSVVLEEIGAPLGQLYRVDRQGRPVLAACKPNPPDPTLLAQAARCFTTFTHSLEEAVTSSLEELSESVIESMGVRYEAFWLRHPERADELRGMLLVPTDALRMAAFTPGLRHALGERLLQLV